MHGKQQTKINSIHTEPGEQKRMGISKTAVLPDEKVRGRQS